VTTHLAGPAATRLTASPSAARLITTHLFATRSPTAHLSTAHLTTALAHLPADSARLLTHPATGLVARLLAGPRTHLTALSVPLATPATTLLVSSSCGPFRASLLGLVVFVFCHGFSPLAAGKVGQRRGLRRESR
jgi:predicted RNA-binding Zn ribbon-like protein